VLLARAADDHDEESLASVTAKVIRYINLLSEKNSRALGGPPPEATRFAWFRRFD